MFTRETIARDEIGGVLVSTIYLDAPNFGGGEGIRYYETMVFGGKYDQEQERCSTREEALAQHAALLAKVKEAVTC